MDMMVTKRRPARSVVRSAVRPGDGPRVLPHPGLRSRFAVGGELLVVFPEPAREVQQARLRPAVRAEQLDRLLRARARQTPDDELLVLPGNRAFTAFTNPGTGCGPFGVMSATGTFTAPTACCSPNSFVRTSRYTWSAAASPKSNECASWTEIEAARVTAPERLRRNGGTGVLARADACPVLARARALSCEGTDAREAMCLRVR